MQSVAHPQQTEPMSDDELCAIARSPDLLYELITPGGLLDRLDDRQLALLVEKVELAADDMRSLLSVARGERDKREGTGA